LETTLDIYFFKKYYIFLEIIVMAYSDLLPLFFKDLFIAIKMLYKQNLITDEEKAKLKGII
jgi:hypothetical protein